mgnify:CR=1 FL=1
MGDVIPLRADAPILRGQQFDAVALLLQEYSDAMAMLAELRIFPSTLLVPEAHIMALLKSGVLNEPQAAECMSYMPGGNR